MKDSLLGKKPEPLLPKNQAPSKSPKPTHKTAHISTTANGFLASLDEEGNMGRGTQVHEKSLMSLFRKHIKPHFGIPAGENEAVDEST